MWRSDTVTIGKDPQYSFVIFASRLWSFEQFTEHVKTLDFPFAETEFLVILDTKSEAMRLRWLTFLEQEKAKGWNGLYLHTTGLVPLHDHHLVYLRRERIIVTKELSARFIGNTKWTFCLEDDTFIPCDSFKRLLATAEGEENVAFVEGVESGRWGLKMVGVWGILEADGEPVHVYSMVPPVDNNVDNLEEIQGAGFYCYITLTELYKSIPYEYKGACWGPDVCYCYALTRLGHRALVDWSIKCGHLTEGGLVEVDNEILRLDWHKFGEEWKMKHVSV